ncbi:MAG TPA: ATP-dependent protease subunit HslV, partial [Candidatus Kapabacteria bacterium]|nr:ATP-dependent protease subunit HslV [Candidatus Kapabacteria bacterium]
STHGNLQRASIELAKDWRMDRYLRRLEAMLIVMDKNSMFLLSGTGDVVEPEEPVIAIGSGGLYAYASALSLMQFSNLEPVEIVNESLKVASKICIFTNTNFSIETLE